MKIIDISKKIAAFVIRYIPIALGFIVGIVTVYRFEKIVDGILGIVTVFFIYLLFLPEKIYVFKRAPMQIIDQQIIKYSAADFFIALITYWSLQHATDAILTIIKL
jgi:hypothetical protein